MIDYIKYELKYDVTVYDVLVATMFPSRC